MAIEHLQELKELLKRKHNKIEYEEYNDFNYGHQEIENKKEQKNNLFKIKKRIKVK